MPITLKAEPKNCKRLFERVALIKQLRGHLSPRAAWMTAPRSASAMSSAITASSTLLARYALQIAIPWREVRPDPSLARRIANAMLLPSCRNAGLREGTHQIAARNAYEAPIAQLRVSILLRENVTSSLNWYKVRVFPLKK